MLDVNRFKLCRLNRMSGAYFVLVFCLAMEPIDDSGQSDSSRNLDLLGAQESAHRYS